MCPEAAKEWHPTLNGDKKPSDFMPGSGYRAWWKCSKCGHEWQTRILHRRNGVGCPALGLLYFKERFDYYHEDITKCYFFENGWYEKVVDTMGD